jgi:thiamine-monophosphate kinase
VIAPERLQSLSVADLGEHALIDRITSRLAMPPWVVVGPGDDAAVVTPDRGALDVLTTDALVDGVHFDLRLVPPEAIGHRALAVSLSDLAAMGAQPRVALLSLVLPGTLPAATVDGLLDGLLALAATHRVALVGGNIARTPGPLVVDVTAVGSVSRRRILRRSGARPGDEVFVTGTLGDGAVGWRALAAAGSESLAAARGAASAVARYLRPEPRIRAGLVIGRNRAATSCIDLSDGLADGVRQIAAASGVGITIDAGAVPVGDDVGRWSARQGGEALELALSGGDDYELLFTARPSHRGRLRTVRRQLGALPLTRIGTVTREQEVLLRDATGRTRGLTGGFEHFRRE